MLNPGFFQLDTQDGEMHLKAPRLDMADPRTLDDIGLTEAEWMQANSRGRREFFLAALVETVRRVFVRLRGTDPEQTAALRNQAIGPAALKPSFRR